VKKTVDTQRTNQVLNLWNRNFVQTWFKSRINQKRTAKSPGVRTRLRGQNHLRANSTKQTNKTPWEMDEGQEYKLAGGGVQTIIMGDVELP